MSRGTEIREPKAFASITGAASAASVSVTAEVGSPVTAEVLIYGGPEAGQEVQEVTGEDILGILGGIQQNAFAGNTAPNSQIRIEDGKGGTYDFEGYMTGPSYTLGRNNIQPGAAVTGAGTIIEQLKLEIYTPNGNGDFDRVLTAGNKGDSKKIRGGNLATRLKELTQLLIREWNRVNKGSSYLSPIDKILRENRDRINNQGPLEAWYELLDGSVAQLNYAWMAELSDNVAFNHEFNQTLLRLITTTSTSFTEIINSLCAQFMLLWVPSPDGRVGKLIKAEQVTTDDTASLELSSVTLEQSGSPVGGLFPIRQVVMLIQATPTHYNQGDTQSQEAAAGFKSVLGAYPEDPSGNAGDVLVIENPPEFLAHAIEIGSPSIPASRPENFDSFDQILDQTIEIAAKFHNGVIAAAVQELCRNAYLNAVLRSSSLRITVPLDVKLWPGKRYSVVNDQGEELFIGFLRSVSHYVTTGTSSTAHSGLTFSHVMYPGFTIPQ